MGGQLQYWTSYLDLTAAVDSNVQLLWEFRVNVRCQQSY